MGWLIGIGVALAIIYFMIVSPGFRGVMVFLIIVGGLWIWWLIDSNKKESEHNERQQAEIRRKNAEAARVAAAAIKEDELSLNNLSLTKNYNYWDLKGSVLNNSKHTLKSISFLIVMKDCPTPDKCTTIGQNNSTARFEGVPSNQARGFSTSFTFKDMPEPRRLNWSYSVTGIMADY